MFTERLRDAPLTGIRNNYSGSLEVVDQPVLQQLRSPGVWLHLSCWRRKCQDSASDLPECIGRKKVLSYKVVEKCFK